MIPAHYTLYTVKYTFINPHRSWFYFLIDKTAAPSLMVTNMNYDKDDIK